VLHWLRRRAKEAIPMANKSLYTDTVVSTPSFSSDIPGLSSVVQEYQTAILLMHRQILDLDKRVQALENKR
jgi:hypothetical protein